MLKYSRELACLILLLMVSTASCQIISPLQKIVKSQELIDEAFKYYQAGNYTKAIEIYTKAIELNPHSQTIFFNRGVCYGKIKDYTNAIKDYTKFLDTGQKTFDI